MSLSLTIKLTPEQFPVALSALQAAGLIGASHPGPAPSGLPAPPRAAAPAPPPMAAAPPPPPPAPAAAAQSPKLAEVLKLMDAYARAGHQIAGARKVLAHIGLSRAQDANEEQLEWLGQAFANTTWAP